MSDWHRGVVTSVRDPDSKGRVRLRVPQLLGPVETGWIEPMFPSVNVSVGDKVFVSAEMENMPHLLFAATGGLVGDRTLRTVSVLRGRSSSSAGLSIIVASSASVEGASSSSGSAIVGGMVVDVSGVAAGEGSASLGLNLITYGEWSNTLNVTTNP